MSPIDYQHSKHPLDSPEPTAELVAQAAHWHTLMQADRVSDNEQAEFSAWLTEEPEHALAYQRIDTLWGDIDGFETQRERAIVETVLQGRKKEARHRKRRIASAGAMLSAALTLGILQLAPGNHSLTEVALSGRLFADYRTDVGETREITLSDQSRLRLNTFSSVDIEYSDTQRIVRLRQGEIQIQVAKDLARPLLVITGQGSARALGTEFSVRENKDVTEVSVTESRVEVCATNTSACQQLQTGQTTKINAGQVHLPRASNKRFVHDWSRQLLIVDEQPVLEVLDELMRYHRGFVQIDRKALANERVSGVFALKNFAKSLQALEGSTQLSVSSYTPWYTAIDKKADKK